MIDWTTPEMQANLQALASLAITFLVAVLTWGMMAFKEYLKTKTNVSQLEGKKVRVETIDLIAAQVVQYLEQTNKIDPKTGPELRIMAIGMITEALRTLGIEVTYQEVDIALESNVKLMNEGKIDSSLIGVLEVSEDQ